jgi:hypothetical protein
MEIFAMNADPPHLGRALIAAKMMHSATVRSNGTSTRFNRRHDGLVRSAERQAPLGVC